MNKPFAILAAAGVLTLTALAGTVATASAATTAGPAAAHGAAMPVPQGTVTAVKFHGSLPANLKSLKNSSGASARGIVPMHYSNYLNPWWDSQKWGVNVQVDWGQDRAWTRCSDGWIYYGAWVGQGYWIFGGNCAPHNATLEDFGVQNG